MKQTAMKCVVLTIISVVCTILPLSAQDPPEPQGSALRVFLDCGYYCDFDHLRREITFVNWVRDRQDAQVHVLVTTQRTGGGGTEFTMAFIGMEEFRGREDTLQYVSGSTDVQDEVRNGIARTLSLGLVRYAAQLPVGADLRVVHGMQGRQRPRPAAATAEDDPWNFWVFNISAHPFLMGEESYRSTHLSGSVSASRTTEDFKISLSAHGSYSNDVHTYEDVDYTDTRRDFGFNTRAIWSLGDHWSWGIIAGARSSTRYNQDLVVDGTPALEYNIFPYSESTRRQLTFRYSAGVRSINYEEETIYFETAEVRPLHSLEVDLDATQPWGTAGVSFEAFQYLHDLGKHRLTFRPRMRIRLFKGFSFNISGSVSRVKDQLYLSREGVSDEDILVRRRALDTNYRYSLFGGLSFRFGSIFNNVVNPRFGGGGGGMIMMF